MPVSGQRHIYPLPSCIRREYPALHLYHFTYCFATANLLLEGIFVLLFCLWANQLIAAQTKDN